MNSAALTPYFDKINEALKKRDRAIPCLLIDLDKLDANITRLQHDINPNVHYRIVVKSLPSFELIQYIMKKTTTQKLMVFHQPFLSDLSKKLDDQADILIGKPMPVKTAAYHYHNIKASTLGFDSFQQIQWLVDTQIRIQEYIDLAKSLGKKLRLNVELDVGLRRGGFSTLKDLSCALQLIADNDALVEFSGFMGYDPHVVKIPSMLRSTRKSLQLSNSFYQEAKVLLKEQFPSLWKADLTFNGAGSPTINLHKTDDSPLNDIAAGSCLVKPTTFDIPSLKSYEAATFIATPVLKRLAGTTLPGLENFKGILNILNKKNRQSYFIYGGFWKADYCYPFGIQQNDLFGASTNQTMLNASESTKLAVDDFVFLRPHQSEFVLLQFGEILTLREGRIQETWTLLQNY